MGKGRAWTLDETETLRTKMALGQTIYSIAASQGWAYSSAKQEARRLRLGIPPGKTGRPVAMSDALQATVAGELESSPKTSLRLLSRKHGVPYSTLRRFVQAGCRLKAFKVVKVQALSEKNTSNT